VKIDVNDECGDCDDEEEEPQDEKMVITLSKQTTCVTECQPNL